MVANMGGVFPCLARHSGDGHSIELPGVTAAVTPSCPDRSIVNCVMYTDTAALSRSLDALSALYESAGVRAWTVWVPNHDTDAAELLDHAGHLLDARPAAMVCELSAIEPPGIALDLSEPDMVEAARVNDVAYGLAGEFERAFRRLPPEPAYLYMARAGGVPACTLLTYEEDGECGIYLVATLPEARGGGLASALMAHALLEARERGCTTSSLQATARGRPVYKRLGYEEIGTMDMWERRRQV